MRPLSLRIVLVAMAILLMLHSNLSCIQRRKISTEIFVDSIVYVKVWPKRYFEYTLGKYMIYKDTISVEWFFGASKHISKALFSGKREIIGVIKDSLVLRLGRPCKISYEYYNYHDYIRKKPSLTCIGIDSSSTDINYPLGYVGRDSILNIPVLYYYFDKAINIDNAVTFDSVMNSPPNDSVNHSKRFSVVHPIFGLIEGFESGRAIDTLYFLKGSYIDIIAIEKRLGIR